MGTGPLSFFDRCSNLEVDPDTVPPYWENDADVDCCFNDLYPVSPEERQILQALLNGTAKFKDKCFRLVRGIRVENSAVWAAYQRHASRLRRKLKNDTNDNRCVFAGRGAPATVTALEAFRRENGFTRNIDASINEAYLWHATSPHVAIRIAQNGFDVGAGSAVGKRFGRGGYFSEDSASVDKYARSGKGLYKDCNAMLLCRTLLGHQFLTTDFRADDLSRKVGYDSTLAEPNMSTLREFIVYENAQIYPEYVLVYEHRTLREMNLLAKVSLGVGLEVTGGLPPPYWFHRGCVGTFFHETCPAEIARPAIQAIMKGTWNTHFTQDRRRTTLGGDGDDSIQSEGDVPVGPRVLKVLRVEDSDMWAEYAHAQAETRMSMCTTVGKKSSALSAPAAEAAFVKTTPCLEPAVRERLATDVNEVYLWHGSSPQAVMSIAERGFPPELGAFNHGRFGDGAYLVEDASHADEYSSDDVGNSFHGFYAMLLCRVTLGRMQRLLPGCDELDVGESGFDFDSIVGEVPASGNTTLREFLVPRRSQIYPEYAIIYEREYPTPRLR
eukprot:TRINITY_DN21667_c0_g3_i1.p1 TRINITY_DN21667_c0_g3~~TRINITY_DN21667_c0_g3_i1.p1  ORF type:complete len:554 (+),score=66.41 TRINITY_DN21667_c0_g3_i1:73-1734(+)